MVGADGSCVDHGRLDGSSQPVRVFVDNNVAGNNDAIDIYNAAGTAKLAITAANLLRLNADYVSGDAWLNGTMAMSGNNVVVTVGSVISGGTNLHTGVTTLASMTWASSTAATDVAATPPRATRSPRPADDRDF